LGARVGGQGPELRVRHCEVVHEEDLGIAACNPQPTTQQAELRRRVLAHRGSSGALQGKRVVVVVGIVRSERVAARGDVGGERIGRLRRLEIGEERVRRGFGRLRCGDRRPIGFEPRRPG
jgi:hypothetical protein